MLASISLKSRPRNCASARWPGRWAAAAGRVAWHGSSFKIWLASWGRGWINLRLHKTSWPGLSGPSILVSRAIRNWIARIKRAMTMRVLSRIGARRRRRQVSVRIDRRGGRADLEMQLRLRDIAGLADITD